MTTIKVPFIDLRQRFEEERVELLACVERVLALGHFVLTREVGEFEERAAAYAGVKHCVGLNSGTDALMMALWALGIGRGDEVITTPVSFVATTGAIAHVGATPVYADIGDDMNIDPADIERRITPRTKAIMPVHWTGRIADMDPIMEIARRHGLAVIEDAAQTMGARYKGRHGGSFGAASAFSAHPLKNLNALGDGGFLMTNDDEIARKVRLYRTHGLQDRDTCVFYGVNSRLDSLNAEVLKYRLERLDEVVAKRRRNVALYRALIKPGPVRIFEDKPYEENAHVMFLVQADNRDGLKAYLAENGIESLVYYGRPLHLHPAGEKYGWKRGDFPRAEDHCDRVLALPHHQQLSEAQIALVADAVNRFYGG